MSPKSDGKRDQGVPEMLGGHVNKGLGGPGDRSQVWEQREWKGWEGDPGVGRDEGPGI